MEIKSIFGNYEISCSIEKMALIKKLGVQHLLEKSKKYEVYRFNNEVLVILLSSCAKLYHYNLKSKMLNKNTPVVFDVLIDCYKHINNVLTKLKNKQKQINIKNGISDGKHTRLMNNIKINDVYFCEQNSAYGEYGIKSYKFFMVTEVLKSSIRVVPLETIIKETKSGIKYCPDINNVQYSASGFIYPILRVYKDKPLSFNGCELKKLKTSFVKG